MHQKGRYVHTLYHGEEVVAQIIDIELHERTQEPMYLLYASPRSHNGLSVSFWGYEDTILSVDLIAKYFELLTDENEQGWYKPRKHIKGWKYIKHAFEHVNDYFVKGWVTQSPYTITKHLIKTGEWEL